jgi:hypothetical protein
MHYINNNGLHESGYYWSLILWRSGSSHLYHIIIIDIIVLIIKDNRKLLFVKFIYKLYNISHNRIIEQI